MANDTRSQGVASRLGETLATESQADEQGLQARGARARRGRDGGTRRRAHDRRRADGRGVVPRGPDRSAAGVDPRRDGHGRARRPGRSPSSVPATWSVRARCSAPTTCAAPTSWRTTPMTVAVVSRPEWHALAEPCPSLLRRLFHLALERELAPGRLSQLVDFGTCGITCPGATGDGDRPLRADHARCRAGRRHRRRPVRLRGLRPAAARWPALRRRRRDRAGDRGDHVVPLRRRRARLDARVTT